MNIIDSIEHLIAQGVESALTVWPEWQFPIKSLPRHPPDPTGLKGDKGVENRSWPPPAKLQGKLFALHWGAHIGGRPGATARYEGCVSMLGRARLAGWKQKGLTSWTVEMERDGITVIFDADALVRGGIDTIVRLSHVTPPSMVRLDDPYYIGEFGWRFEVVEKLATPIPCKGAQGLWPLRSLLGQDVGRPPTVLRAESRRRSEVADAAKLCPTPTPHSYRCYQRSTIRCHGLACSSLCDSCRITKMSTRTCGGYATSWPTANEG